VSPFLSARAYVSALLGAPDYERPRTDSPIVRLRPACARWGRYEGASLTLTDGADDLVPTLHAERPNGDARTWTAIGDGTVRDAAAWLGWSLPRTTLPGLAPPDDEDERPPLSPEALARLDAAIQSGREGRVRPFDSKWLTVDDDDGPTMTLDSVAAVCDAPPDDGLAPVGYDANGSPVEAA